jgi:DNA-binding NarL/FixJ family response regulator
MIELKPDIKVLVASAYNMNNSVDDILTKGANGFIQKPYRIDNIIVKIRQVMQG